MYIGLDIGGTKCAAVVGECGSSYKIIEKIKFSTTNLTPQDVLEKFSAFIKDAISKYSVDAIGISCGGPLDSKKGVILCPPSLPLWDNIYIVKYFQDKFGLPTRLLNDANAGAVAEWKYGAGKGADDMVFITCGIRELLALRRFSSVILMSPKQRANYTLLIRCIYLQGI